MNDGIQGFPSRIKSTSKFHKTMWFNGGGADITTTSTSFIDIDSINLPALLLNLTVGDVVELVFTSPMTHQTTGNVVKMDWSITRPKSITTSIGALFNCQAAACFETATTQGDGINARTIMCYFTCTEGGLHTFKPQWRVSGGTAIILQAGGNYGIPIVHSVKNLGPEF